MGGEAVSLCHREWIDAILLGVALLLGGILRNAQG